MADPVTLAIAGAGIGAATSDDPLKGAALGGLGGWAGGTFLGPMMGAAPGTGLGATGAGSQAAMLAAQNEGLGATAGMLTNASLASNPALGGASGFMAPIYQGMGDMGMSMGNMPFAGKGPNMMKAGMMLNNNNQQQQRPAPVFAQAPRFEGQNATVRPYQPGVVGPNPGQAMMQFDGYMPGYNKYSPY